MNEVIKLSDFTVGFYCQMNEIIKLLCYVSCLCIKFKECVWYERIALFYCYLFLAVVYLPTECLMILNCVKSN